MKKEDVSIKNHFLVDISGKQWKIIASYKDFSDYKNNCPEKPEEHQAYWLEMIISNIRRFSIENVLEFIPNLTLKEIHSLK